MDKNSKIFVAGHKGLVGSAIIRRLQLAGYSKIIREKFDMRNQKAINDFFTKHKPEYVFQCAAKVGGIMANSTYPAEFIYDNLMIQSNLIEAAHYHNVKKFLFMGSSCIYPKHCPQPIKEEYLLSGQLEPTNEPYAIAKIAGIKMCQAYNKQYFNKTKYISVMPTNLYGPGDTYDVENSHVIPALIMKIHKAKIQKGGVKILGSGKALREFLYVSDLADACVFLMNNYDDSEIINIGTGKDITIEKLSRMIADIIGFTGKFGFHIDYPDGTPRKLLDISKITSLGWKPKVSLEEGLTITIKNYYTRCIDGKEK